MRVLFVDDSSIARVSMAKRLSSRGASVLALASAREAQAVDGGDFDCALLDLELDDGTGPDVAAALRRSAAGLPIAFLTGGGGPAAVLAAARGLGPVFDKLGGVEEAVDWVMNAATTAASPPTPAQG